MRRIGLFSLVMSAGMLALVSCNSSPAEAEVEVEETGYLYHLEFNRTHVAGEDVNGTMWVLLRREDAIWVAEMFLEDPERLGSIRGEVHPGPGVDPNVQFHFDPDGTVLFQVQHPADDCIIDAPAPSIVEEILDGRRRGLCANRVRVLEFMPASDEPEL